MRRSATGVDLRKDTGYTGVMGLTTRHAMPEPTRRSMRFLFISGRLCLDFVHTGGEDEREDFEVWHAPDDLAEWLAESPLRLSGVAISAADLRVARALREAIWHSAIACLDGREPLAQWVQVINGMARQPDLVPQLDAQGQPSVWHLPHTVSAVLSTIARDAIALFSGAEARLIRQCANPGCLLLFVDASRPGKRRWCSMERCGNRAKVAHYRRQRSAGTTRSRECE